MMKNLIISLLIGLAMVTFTGCTNSNNAETVAKCDGDKVKEVATKCDSSGKCGK